MKQNLLSPKTVQKAVLANTLQHPGVLYPAVGGILTASAGIVFAAGAWPLIVGAGAFISAVGVWGIQFFGRRDRYTIAYFNEIHAVFNREKQKKLAKLIGDLQQVGSDTGVKQLELLGVKYRNFEEILATKLNPSEITFSRYIGIAEQVYLAVLDNLDKVYLALKSVSTVDVDYLQQRLRQLNKDSRKQAQEERKTLEQRWTLRQQQLERSADLLLANERALTQLDEATATLAEVQMQKGRADVDLDSAMEELRRMAERTSDYAK